MVRKGCLVTYETLQVIEFQLNPVNITDAKASTYAALTAPGGSQPMFQWTNGGKRTIGLTLRFYYSDRDRAKVEANCSLLKSLQYPETDLGRTKRPPERVLLIIGDRPDVLCHVENCSVKYSPAMHPEGLYPLWAEVTLQLVEDEERVIDRAEVRNWEPPEETRWAPVRGAQQGSGGNEDLGSQGMMSGSWS